MIKYSLSCRGCGDEFESWFAGSAEFDKLAARGLLSCPKCGGPEVGKAVMAPAVSKGGRGQSRPVDAERAAADVKAALRELRRKVESSCENVGERFAEESLRMHRGEAPERAIYGDATPDEYRKLVDEGVPVAKLPWIPLTDA